MQPPENDDSRSTGPLPRYLTPDFYAELAKHRRRHPVAEKVKRALRKREDYLELGQRQAALRDGLESELSPEQLRQWRSHDRGRLKQARMEAAEHYNLGVQAGMEMNLVEFMINAARRKPGYLNPWYAVGAVADVLLRMASREGKAIDDGDTLQWP